MRWAGKMPQCRPNHARNGCSNDIADRLSRLARGSGVVIIHHARRREVAMINRRTLVSLALSASLLIVAGAALAKNEHHSDGHNLLGAKLGQNGKHEVGRIGSNAVTAEVNNKKVVGMSAGNLPVKKVKSNKKMAGLDHLQMAANGEIQLAQVADVYYGYCFDTGLDEYCYWYPASDVVVTVTWIIYSP